jgi:hypothetical protein
MVNDLPVQYLRDEMERDAYNAAFDELGFSWHWDSDTYDQLLRQGSNAEERISHYLETRQPHLLKAYEAAFLVAVIQQKKAEHRKRLAATRAVASGYFEWAESLVIEFRA